MAHKPNYPSLTFCSASLEQQGVLLLPLDGMLIYHSILRVFWAAWVPICTHGREEQCGEQFLVKRDNTTNYVETNLSLEHCGPTYLPSVQNYDVLTTTPSHLVFPVHATKTQGKVIFYLFLLWKGSFQVVFKLPMMRCKPFHDAGCSLVYYKEINPGWLLVG